MAEHSQSSIVKLSVDLGVALSRTTLLKRLLNASDKFGQRLPARLIAQILVFLDSSSVIRAITTNTVWNLGDQLKQSLFLFIRKEKATQKHTV